MRWKKLTPEYREERHADLTRRGFVPVPGFDGYYVDCAGTLYSLHMDTTMRQAESRTGYYAVILMLDGKPRYKKVHGLVAGAFIGPCPAGYEVNHKDANKKNNNISNLEYITHEDNLAHARKLGLMFRRPVLAYHDKDCTELAARYAGVCEAADTVGVCHPTIINGIKRRVRMGGYYWKYEGERHGRGRKSNI